MKALTHTDIQEAACRALKLAMKEGIAVETRQVGDDIQLTTVVEQDVEGTVLAVSYPDGGIDYYPTEITRDERMAHAASQIKQLGEAIIGKEMRQRLLGEDDREYMV